MLGVWKKRKGEFVFIKLTDKEALDITQKVTEFNVKVIKDCFAKADKVLEELPEIGNDGMVRVALALFDKSALQSFSVMKTELDKPLDE